MVWPRCHAWYGSNAVCGTALRMPNTAYGMAPMPPMVWLQRCPSCVPRDCSWHSVAQPGAARGTSQPCPWHSVPQPSPAHGTARCCPWHSVAHPSAAQSPASPSGRCPDGWPWAADPPPPQRVSRVGTSPVQGRGTLPGPPPSDSRHSSWAPPLPADVEAVPETCQRWGGSQGHRLRLPPVLGGG